MNIKENLHSDRIDLNSLFNEVKAYINNLYPEEKYGNRDGYCEEVAIKVKQFLFDRGIASQILEGDLEVGENDYLSHQINLIDSGDHFWLIDLSSKQVPFLNNKDWLIEKINKADLREFLKQEYHWWFKKEEKDKQD